MDGQLPCQGNWDYWEKFQNAESERSHKADGFNLLRPDNIVTILTK